MATENESGKLEGFDPRLVFTDDYKPVPGDALLVLTSDQGLVLGRSAIAAMILRTTDGARFYQGITLLAPPLSAWNVDDESAAAMLIRGIADIKGTELSESEKESLKAVFQVVRCDDLEGDDLLRKMRLLPERQFVLMPDASMYKDAHLLQTAGTQATVKFEEDLWVPHMASIAEQCVGVALERHHYLVMTSTENAPMRQAANDALLAIPNVSVIGLREQQHEFVELSERWVALAVCGRKHEALTELEATELPDLTKRQARMLIHSRAGDHAEAARIVVQLLGELEISADTAVRWANICFKGDSPATARQLLQTHIERVSEEAILEAALELSTQLKQPALTDLAWARLSRLFPNNAALKLNSELRLLQHCRQTAPSAGGHSYIGFSEHQAFLVDRLEPTAVNVDYEPLLAEFERRWPEHKELAVACAAHHAESQEAPIDALTLASQLIPETRFSQAAARVMVRVMRQLLLLEQVGREDLEFYKLPTAGLIAHLSQHPHDAVLRQLALDTLSVGHAGALGLPILASVALDFSQSAPDPLSERHTVAPADDLAYQAFMGRLRSWLPTQAAIDAVAPFPAQVAGTNAAGLARLLHDSLEQQVLSCGIGDLEGLEWQAQILSLVNQHVPGSAYDLHAWRLLAAKYAALGNHQRARDLAEQIFKVAGGTDERRRLAWGAYADIYQRTNGLLNALMGIASAAFTQAALPASELFHEVYTLARIARQLGLLEIAQSVLQTCRQLYAMVGMTDTMRHRLDVIELGIRVIKLPKGDAVALAGLLAECRSSLEHAIALGDEVSVCAYQFAQVARAVEQSGQPLAEEVRALIEYAMTQLAPEAAAALRALSADRPDAHQLVRVFNQTPGARLSEDAPNDLLTVTVAAPRLLAANPAEIPVEHFFLAIELLADKGMVLGSPAPALDVDWPARYARTLVGEGYSVLMLGLDEHGELVAGIAAAAGLNVVRAPAGAESMKARLRHWAVTYPYQFGLIDSHKVGAKEFYAAMAPFQIPMPYGVKVVVVGEPAIMQLTFNLILRNGRDFIGHDTALAMVPSLTWLSSVRTKPMRGDGRRLAWVSYPGPGGDLRTMEVVMAMLEPTLQTHGIALETVGELPQNFRGAQMAVVTAHGQLTTEEKFIHRIVDEDDLKESPPALARALAHVELVILFVCSGGRVDVDPMSNATVSLPKMLLNEGCRTIIASPWPLNSGVPGLGSDHSWRIGMLAQVPSTPALRPTSTWRPGTKTSPS